jgi:hypothetical protein
MKPKKTSRKTESAHGGCLERMVLAPDWLLDQEQVTQRQWRIRKRRDLKQLIAAYDAYQMGCAYCPGKNGEVGTIGKLLDELKESHSIKKWGR